MNKKPDNHTCQICQRNPRAKVIYFSPNLYWLCAECAVAGKFATGNDVTKNHDLLRMTLYDLEIATKVTSTGKGYKFYYKTTDGKKIGPCLRHYWLQNSRYGSIQFVNLETNEAGLLGLDAEAELIEEQTL